ncbi:hypothetical protein WJX74_007018 [Apatococcus lobatus]|uniref:Uncharacterized protein n=1 Tax=Apatococcus lobatus TaxID=904363 RepID=A0AAW1S2C5_9CHLO
MACLSRTVRQLASGRLCQSSWSGASTRAFATREGASTEEKYGKETDDNMAPPKGSQQKEGHDLDKKADSQEGKQSPEEAMKDREQAAKSSGQTEGSPPDLEDIPRGPSGRPDDPHTDPEKGINHNG